VKKTYSDKANFSSTLNNVTCAVDMSYNRACARTHTHTED